MYDVKEEMDARALRFVLLAVGLAGAACSGAGSSSATPAPIPSPSPRPNIVLILVDDQDVLAMSSMPRLKALIADRGVTFPNGFVTTSLCAPSRASILTGLYAHNHGTRDNVLPLGGFQKFYGDGRESNTIATWLKAAGYRTIFLGKYINGYPAGPGDYVPPGWDDWHGSFVGGEGEQGLYYDYYLNDNGKVTQYGHDPTDYATDVLAQKAVEAIRAAAADKTKPFLMYLAPPPPHMPAIYAPRHDGIIKDAFAPRLPSYNEQDLTGKPRFLHAYDRLTPAQEVRNDQIWAARLACMLAVDEMIDKLVQELTAQGALANTYIFYMSDNGLLMGQHRLVRAKDVAYEESIKVPFYVTGPGVPAGQTRTELVANIDLAPTFVEWARASAPDLDGRSLVPLLSGAANVPWRSDLLFEHWVNAKPDADLYGVVPSYYAVRSRDAIYVEYGNDIQDRELYDLQADPYELDNLYYQNPVPPALAQLAPRLAALKDCRGASCRN